MSADEPSRTATPADFFVSYTKVDEDWAVWIAWCLEDAGHHAVVQAWDFRPGDNFVALMQQASISSRRTIAVLSNAYLEALFTQPEWMTAFRQDPTSEQRKLVPVRIKNCTKPTGMLGSLIHIDLVGCTEDEARRKLLDGIRRGRGKPSAKPMYPGLALSFNPGTQGTPTVLVQREDDSEGFVERTTAQPAGESADA